MQCGSMAEWFSGGMSFLAVVVALWLACDARKVKLRGYCCIRKGARFTASVSNPLRSAHTMEIYRDSFLLLIKNCGNIPVIIMDIKIKVGRFRNTRILPSFFNQWLESNLLNGWLEGNRILSVIPDPASSKLPVKISGGEERVDFFS